MFSKFVFTIIIIYLLSVILSCQVCEANLFNHDDPLEMCRNLCNSCGGIGSYVDDHCECYINEINDRNTECVGRIRRQAEDINLDLLDCRPATPECPFNCNNRPPYRGRLREKDIKLLTRYFMSDGPSKGFPFLRERCDNTNPYEFKSTTPTDPFIDEVYTNERSDYYDSSTPTNQIEDPYCDPEQARTIPSTTPPYNRYINPTSTTPTPVQTYIYKCTKYAYPPASPSSSSSSYSSSPSPIIIPSVVPPLISPTTPAPNPIYHHPMYRKLTNGLIKSPNSPVCPCSASSPPSYSSLYSFANPYYASYAKYLQNLSPSRKMINEFYKTINQQNSRQSYVNPPFHLTDMNSAYYNPYYGGSSASITHPQNSLNYNYNLIPKPSFSYPMQPSLLTPYQQLQLQQQQVIDQHKILQNFYQQGSSRSLQPIALNPSIPQYPNYIFPNNNNPYNIVGATHNNQATESSPARPQEQSSMTWTMQSTTTPESSRTVGNSVSVTNINDVKIQDDSDLDQEVMNTEIKGGNMMGETRLTEDRSHRIIPILKRRLTRETKMKNLSDLIE